MCIRDRYQVTLEGEKLGQLIGRRGETLDAIQQLTNYAVNSGADKRIRVHVDAENYRAKREQSLESLARKVAGKVTKYRRLSLIHIYTGALAHRLQSLQHLNFRSVILRGDGGYFFQFRHGFFPFLARR